MLYKLLPIFRVRMCPTCRGLPIFGPPAGVTRVFFGLDFISVTKEEEIQWDVLKPSILTSIMEHYASGKPLIENFEEHHEGHNNSEADNEVVKQIKELIDERVRPAVAMDGGDIVFCSYSEGIVTLQMRGACAG